MTNKDQTQPEKMAQFARERAALVFSGLSDGAKSHEALSNFAWGLQGGEYPYPNLMELAEGEYEKHLNELSAEKPTGAAHANPPHGKDLIRQIKEYALHLVQRVVAGEVSSDAATDMLRVQAKFWDSEQCPEQDLFRHAMTTYTTQWQCLIQEHQKSKYVYFVCYQALMDGRLKMGRCETTVDGEIRSIDDISALETNICQQIPGASQVVMMNFQLLRTECN